MGAPKGNQNSVGNQGWKNRKEHGRKVPISEEARQRIIAANKARARPWKERFEEKLDRNGPIPTHRPELGQCWEWIPAQGRPRSERRRCLLFHVSGEGKPFYHYLYEEEHGPTFRGHELEPDHVCLNWRCARPSHIEPVTHQENMRRHHEAREKGWCE